MLERPTDQRAVQRFAAPRSPRHGWVIAAVALLTLAMAPVIGLSLYRVVAPPTATVIEMTYNDFLTNVSANNVSSVTIYNDGNITGQFTRMLTYQQQDGLMVTATTFHAYQRLTPTTSVYLFSALERHGVKVYQRQSGASTPWLRLALTVTPFAMLLGALLAIVIVVLTAWSLTRPQGITPPAQS